MFAFWVEHHFDTIPLYLQYKYPSWNYIWCGHHGASLYISVQSTLKIHKSSEFYFIFSFWPLWTFNSDGRRVSTFFRKTNDSFLIINSPLSAIWRRSKLMLPFFWFLLLSIGGRWTKSVLYRLLISRSPDSKVIDL